MCKAEVAEYHIYLWVQATEACVHNFTDVPENRLKIQKASKTCLMGVTRWGLFLGSGLGITKKTVCLHDYSHI